MDKNQNLVQYKIFESHKNLIAFTTTKLSSKRKTPRYTGNNFDLIKKNREELAFQLGIKTNQFIFPQQTHTNCVAEILEIPDLEIKETDALITNKSGICLCVQTADCVPIILFDPVKNIISAVHAGWRGTVSKIVEKTVQKMISNYSSSPENILVAIGPSISPKIYEVGNEVILAVKKSVPNAELALSKKNSKKNHLNLWEANKQILLSMGIQSQNIEILGECSFQKNDKYFSARKEGIETGRMVSGVMLLS